MIIKILLRTTMLISFVITGRRRTRQRIKIDIACRDQGHALDEYIIYIREYIIFTRITRSHGIQRNDLNFLRKFPLSFIQLLLIRETRAAFDFKIESSSAFSSNERWQVCSCCYHTITSIQLTKLLILIEVHFFSRSLKSCTNTEYDNLERVQHRQRYVRTVKPADRQ